MPGFIVHMGAAVQCAHAGIAQPITVNPRVTVSGQPIVTMANTYSIAGCTFPAMTQRRAALCHGTVDDGCGARDVDGSAGDRAEQPVHLHSDRHAAPDRHYPAARDGDVSEA